MDSEALPEDMLLGALRSVEDPEAGMSIVDLGLVYGVRSEPGRVRVEMTMTSPACPAAPYIVDEAAAAIRAIAPDGTDVSVELVWEPPWTPERMSDEAQEKFGWK
ncbi:MAG: metal-sulfur cluster assembly factor [Burkholderiales bacterium]